MNDLIKLLRGRRIDGRSADEIMRLAAAEIESLQSQLSYRIEERDDSNRNLTAALRREAASKDRLAEAEALLREWRVTADEAKDMTFVPVAKRTDAFLAADSASVAPQKHAVDCTYWDGLMAQVCSCGIGTPDSADPVIHAQHDETGRMWSGPRSQLPRRYFEICSPADMAQIAADQPDAAL